MQEADSFNIPILETPRLRLRPHRQADIDAAAAMWADEQTVRYIGGEIRPRADVWGRMLGLNGLWSIRDFGYWAVEHRDSGEFIGQAGFADFQREVAVAVPDTPEAGWAIRRDMAGQGYASEAVAAALAWLDRERPEFDATHCLIHPKNTASLAVAEKLGFVPSSRTTVGGGLSVVLVRPARRC